jgi:hypothetical protein
MGLKFNRIKTMIFQLTNPNSRIIKLQCLRLLLRRSRVMVGPTDHIEKQCGCLSNPNLKRLEFLSVKL